MTYIEYLELVLSILIERGEGTWLCECNNVANTNQEFLYYHLKLGRAISEQTKGCVFITTLLKVARDAKVSIEEGYVYRQYIMRRLIGAAKLHEAATSTKLEEQQHE